MLIIVGWENNKQKVINNYLENNQQKVINNFYLVSEGKQEKDFKKKRAKLHEKKVIIFPSSQYFLQ